MESIGEDQFGEEVFINSMLDQAESLCVISSVEPHYFAGFTGGRKSFFPGLTDLATIERNHNLANSLEAQPMRIAGNPVAEHMENLLSLIDTSRMLSIQAVLNSKNRIAGLLSIMAFLISHIFPPVLKSITVSAPQRCRPGRAATN